MGAIAAGGIEVLSKDLIQDLGIPHSLVEQVAVRERLELERRDVLYRSGRPAAVVRDRTVILIDDGLATGSTMHAAVLALRQQAPLHAFSIYFGGPKKRLCVARHHVSDRDRR